MKKKNIYSNIINNYVKVFNILLKIDWIYVIILICINILLGIFPTLSIIITQNIVNNLTDISNVKVNMIYLLAGAYIFLDIVEVQINNIFSYFTSIFKLKITFYLEKNILSKSIQLKLTDFENSNSYNKIQRAQNNIEIFDYFLGLLNIIKLLITLATSTLIIIYWIPWLVAPIIVICIINFLFALKISREQYDINMSRTTEERMKWYYKYILTNDIAFKEIKIYNLGNFFINKFIKVYEKFIQQDKNIYKKSTIINVLCSFIDNIFMAIIFIYMIMSILARKILVGDFLAYLRSISNIKSSIQSLLNQIVTIYKQTLYINQLFEFLDMYIDNKDEKFSIESEIDSIEISNLNFKYKTSSDYVLKNINISFKKGDTILLVGRNGSGKTTLTKLLSGFYDDYEGSIKINGIELRKIKKISLYNQISVLFQDFNKYEMSLRENVAIGKLNNMNNDKEIDQALKFSSFSSNKFANLDKQLGFWFDGIQLSGGQWLKLGISRVFFRNSGLLILDEPNSALDTISEKAIFNNILELSKNKISIVISHKISNIKSYSDKIVVLNNREIDGVGTHDELLKSSKIYYKLFMEA